MDNENNIRDYRQFIISKWANTEIESFKKPSEADLENYSKYYKFLIDKFFPKEKSAEILEIGCGWGG